MKDRTKYPNHRAKDPISDNETYKQVYSKGRMGHRMVVWDGLWEHWWNDTDGDIVAENVYLNLTYELLCKSQCLIKNA